MDHSYKEAFMRLVFLTNGATESSSKFRCHVEFGQVNHNPYISEIENISGFGNTEQEAKSDWFVKFQKASIDTARIAAAYNEVDKLVSEAKYRCLSDDILFRANDSEERI